MIVEHRLGDESQRENVVSFAVSTLTSVSPQWSPTFTVEKTWRIGVWILNHIAEPQWSPTFTVGKTARSFARL